MRKVISAFFALICIFASLNFCTLGIFAESAREVYATTSASVKQGNYGYLYVYLDDLTDLAALNVSVYYDPDKITVSSTYNQVSATVYDISTSGGAVNASYIFDGNGGANKTTLFYVYYQVNSTADVGNTYFDIVVTEAYDSSLNDMSFRGSRCTFGITEKTVSKTCSVYSTSSVSTSVTGEFELSYRFSTYQIASGSMSIQYDPELFEVVSATAGRFLEGKVFDINTSLSGNVYLSFVGTTYGNKYDIITVRFRTLKNVTETSNVKLTASELYDLDRNLISCQGYTTRANISFDETYTEDAPTMSVSATYSSATKQLTAVISLEKDSMLGAGDFVFNFDPDLLTYVSSQKGFTPTFFNVNDKKAGEGALKFSIISLEDIVDETTVLTVVFDVRSLEEDTDTLLSISGSGLVDSLTAPIVLNFSDASVTLPKTFILGDVSGDGLVTNADVLVIYRYIYNPELYPLDVTVGDVNGDGLVTNADVLVIFRYIYNPELYPIG